MQDYKAKIGLEVHVQLATKTKMFCRCLADNDKKDPNSLICPVCLGLPGALPVLNEKAIELATVSAMALNCEVQAESRFDRKNYFYPDLPKGYQISQFFAPIGLGGEISVDDNGIEKKIRITRLHLEEDTAKLVHAGNDSLIDYNRCGIPLMEIVSEPDIDSPKMAAKYLKKLRDILVWNKVSEARMQLGEMRCDANISLLDEKGKQVGEVVEIKNMNSFKNVEKALTYEFERQKIAHSNSERIIKETRGFSAQTGVTVGQRTKEHAHDYRYFPEPDVPRVLLKKEKLDLWREKMIKTAEQLALDLTSKYHVQPEIAKLLVEDAEAEKLLLEFLKDHNNDMANDIAKVIFFIIWPFMLEKKIDTDELKLDSIQILINFYLAKKINKNQFSEILWQDFNGEIKDLNKFVEQLNNVDAEILSKLFVEFISDNPEQIDLYKDTEKKLAVTNFFVGYVKRKLQGGGDVEQIKKVLELEMKKK